MDTAQLTLVRQPFDDPNFLFELKHDGFRALAHIWDGNCELISRKRNAYKSFNKLRENLTKLKVQNAVIDGEIVCLDSEGRKHIQRAFVPARLSGILCLRHFISERPRSPAAAIDRTKRKVTRSD
jgi:hypothetical protein